MSTLIGCVRWMLGLGALLCSLTACVTPSSRSPADSASAAAVASAADRATAHRLALFAKVWGYTKYHHPLGKAGARSWDDEYFVLLPRILAAADDGEARALLVAWLDDLGPLPDCAACTPPAVSDLALAPPTAWIQDTQRLGVELSRRLIAIDRLPATPRQGYARPSRAGNVNLMLEQPYFDIPLPSAPHQLLAVFRYWNAIEYWYPYRNLLKGRWDDVLEEFVLPVMRADSRDAYERQMMALIVRIDDTHANLRGALSRRPPAGTCNAPVKVRFVEDQPAVIDVRDGASTTLARGDVILAVAGRRIGNLLRAWRPYYGASNETARRREYARYLLQGPCEPVRVQIRRGSKRLTVDVAREPIDPADRWISSHERSGEAFQRLSPDIAYLKVLSIKGDAIPEYLANAAGTKELIVDLRGYPAEFVVFKLGSHLVDTRTAFAKFTEPVMYRPGTMAWGNTASLDPIAPLYGGRVVLLVDEMTQSQAEYTAMAFRASPRAIVIGSQTAGADGNVSPVPLPGGLDTVFTGLGVFYPDGRPTQQIGIVPDIEVRATLKAVREGRDEVLEAAVRYLTQSPATTVMKPTRCRESRTAQDRAACRAGLILEELIYTMLN